MSIPQSLQVALKEWAVVCRALSTGRQILLLRKGGIYESAGEFELEHRQFLLFPTYVHQNPRMLKPTAGATPASPSSEYADLQPHTTEPARIVLSLAAEVSDIIQLLTVRQMEAIDDEHIWTKPLIEMRFSYRPENPLYLLLLRVYRLDEPVTIDNTPAYAGCKSWVPLEQPVPIDAAPVLPEPDYALRRQRILRQLDSASP